MYLLVYVSTAVQPFTDDQLISLLRQSREKNARLGITGLLLYKAGNFMQLLEGPKDAVVSLANSIKADPRHHGMIVVLQEDHDQREFPGWDMKFQNLDPASFPGHAEDPINLPLTSEAFLLRPTLALHLLLKLRENPDQLTASSACAQAA